MLDWNTSHTARWDEIALVCVAFTILATLVFI